MDPVALTVGLAWTIAGLANVAVAVPLILNRVPPNALYGVRFAQSHASDEAWYAINHHGGKRLAAWSVPIALVGLVALGLPLRTHPTLAIGVGGLPLGFLLIAVHNAWRFAQRYSARGFPLDGKSPA